MKLVAKLIPVLLAGLLIGGETRAAQNNTCATLTQAALERMPQLCEATGRNELCYGNALLEAQPWPGVDNFTFADPGDIVDVMSVSALRSSPMDLTQNIWGVGLMRVQADLADVLPGQLVTFLLFGETELRNAAVETTTLPAMTTRSVNVYGGPSTNHAIIDGLSAGQAVTVVGRTARNSWLRIMLPEDESRVGWIATAQLALDGNVDVLPVIDSADGGHALNSLQAFYFRTSSGDAQCVEAPNSGILIQTPEGTGEITLTLNEVTIRLASTAFLQATDELSINVIEGRARVEAFGVEQEARASMRIRVPLDTNLAASGPPTPPEPCVFDDLQGLPGQVVNCHDVGINLDNECPATVPFGMTIHISNGFGYLTLEEAEADYDPNAAAIVIDGVTVANTVGEIESHEPGMPWGFGVNYRWSNPAPGVHVILGPGPHGSHMGMGRTRTCLITVLEPPE